MKPVQYFKLSTDKPADGQRVWLKIHGTEKPVFAMYRRGLSTHDPGSFTVIDTGQVDTGHTHYPSNYHDKEDTWAPVKPPGEMKSTRRFLEHKGYDDHRLTDPIRNESEITLATEWVKWNKDDGPHGFIKHLIPDPTQRDAKVAATIIQWLGTSIGLAFFAETIRQSPQLASYLARSVSYRERKTVQDQQEKTRDGIRGILQYIEKNCPEVENSEPGSLERNLLMIANTLRTDMGLPRLDPKIERVEE